MKSHVRVRILSPRTFASLLLLAGLAVSSLLPAATVPSSRRSREVSARVSPSLKNSLAANGLKLGNPIFIRIIKQTRELEVWMKRGERFRLFKTYQIHYFSGSLGPKLREGDRQAPEGFYYVPPSRMNPNSRFHLSFNLGYPNTYDRAHGRTGSALMVHGNTVSIGCFAMDDRRIEEIYTIAEAALTNGQSFFRIHIFPFRMTEQNLSKYRESKWFPFWLNLKEGFDFFDRTGSPPDVTVSNRRYRFRKATP